MICPRYHDFCEQLWADWLDDRIDLPAEVRACFQVDYLPEPYLRFGEGNRPLAVLLTNPGEGMPHQVRNTILAGDSCVRREMTYDDVSLAMARWYCENRAQLSSAAATRISALEFIRDEVKADGILQFESLPFHSRVLRNKSALPDVIATTPLLSRYASTLKQAIEPFVVVALSAITCPSIEVSSVGTRPWLQWQASLLGIDGMGLDREPLLTRNDNGKVTSAFLYGRAGGLIRGFVLTIGNNRFPADSGLKKLTAVLGHMPEPRSRGFAS